jgi:PAS domain-containing protein
MGHPLEIILTRQFAGCLSVPIFLVDPKGDLLFYNEAAERILGRRFDETGVLPLVEWASAFTPVDDEGQPIPRDDLPLVITLAEQRPAYKRFHICGSDGLLRHIEVASIPIVGLEGRFLGAAAIFWEISK